MAVPPFDVLGGTTAEDATTASRRFFQYTYQLRLLNDTAFGQDVSLAGLQHHLPHRHADQRRHDVAGTRPDLRAPGAGAAGAVARARRRPRHPRRQHAHLRRPRVAPLPGAGPRHPRLGALRPGRGRRRPGAGARLPARSEHRPGRDRRWSQGAPSCSAPAASCRRSTAPARPRAGPTRCVGSRRGGDARSWAATPSASRRPRARPGSRRLSTGRSRSARGCCAGATRWCPRR